MTQPNDKTCMTTTEDQSQADFGRDHAGPFGVPRTDIVAPGPETPLAPAPLAATGQLDRILGMLERMTEHGASLEAIAKVSDLVKEWADRQARQEFLNAKAEFQAACPMVRKTSRVSYVTKKGMTVNYEFAPLDEIQATISPHLYRNGLSYDWNRFAEDGVQFCGCTLNHVGGGSGYAPFPIILDDSSGMGPQKQAVAALTVARRQALVMVCGLSACEKDRDACLPSHAGPVETITHAQEYSLNDLLIQCGGDDVDTWRSRLLATVKVNDKIVTKLAEIPADRFADLTDTLQEFLAGLRKG